MAATKWTEARVIDALRDLYLPERSNLVQEEWAFLTQVLLRAPDPRFEPRILANGHSKWTLNERKIDVLLVRNWMGGKGHERIAFEVKVTRADYRQDTDLKRNPAEVSAHKCAYAAPAGLIDPTTLPAGWGLIEVSEDAAPKWVVKPARRTPTADLDYLVSAGFRRASRAEEKIRRGDSDAAEVAALRAENERLKGVAARAVEARDREMARSKAARSELMSRFGVKPVCAACGEPIAWTRGRYESQWEHTDVMQERACRRALWDAFEAERAAGLNTPHPSNHPEPVEAGEWTPPSPSVNGPAADAAD